MRLILWATLCVAFDTSRVFTRVVQALEGVRFPGAYSAPLKQIALAEAQKRKARADAGRYGEGQPRWFFHGFNSRSLYFFVGRSHLLSKEDAPWTQDYVVDSILVVPRSPQAERALEVEATLQLWEKGVKGVRGGMNAGQVKQLLGEPTDIKASIEHMAYHSYDYAHLRVHFFQDNFSYVVTHVEEKQ